MWDEPGYIGAWWIANFGGYWISKKAEANEYAILTLNNPVIELLILCPSLPTLNAAKAALLMMLAAR